MQQGRGYGSLIGIYLAAHAEEVARFPENTSQYLSLHAERGPKERSICGEANPTTADDG